jgi:CRP/FNR family transcriptional regulator, anaerobic regulatory protein
MVPLMSTDWIEIQGDLDLGREVLAAKFRSGSPRVLRAGQLLIAGARPNDVLYRLRVGWAYRFRDLADGSRAIIEIYLPGDIIGFDTALCNGPVADVRTLTTTAVEVIAAERGLRDVISSQSIALYISWLLGERQQRTDRLLSAISCLDARGRVATMVLDFYRRLEAQKLITASSFNLPMTQHHIGSYLGVTVVHINRVIRALRDSGIVNIEKHCVSIHNLTALADLAKRDLKLDLAAEGG